MMVEKIKLLEKNKDYIVNRKRLYIFNLNTGVLKIMKKWGIL